MKERHLRKNKGFYMCDKDIFTFEECEVVQGLLEAMEDSATNGYGAVELPYDFGDDGRLVLRGVLDKMLSEADGC